MDGIDFGFLENSLYFTQNDIRPAVLTVQAAELLHPAEMDRFIRTYMPLIKTDDPAVAGTFFCGWFRSVCLVQQYVVSVHDTSLDLSLSNLTVHLYPKNDRYGFAFRCNEMREFQAPPVLRKTWLKEVFTALYRDQVRPLVESVSRSTRANTGLLWGQFATGFHYYLNVFAERVGDGFRRRQIAEDYRFLREQLDGAVFGRKKNPFDVNVRYVDNPWEPGKPLPMKATCCMYYRTEGGDFCYTCPKLTEAERAERKAAILAELKKRRD